jgi:hypothetical protein
MQEYVVRKNVLGVAMDNVELIFQDLFQLQYESVGSV